MRIAALAVLVAMIAGALWLWWPELFESITPSETADLAASNAPATTPGATTSGTSPNASGASSPSLSSSGGSPSDAARSIAPASAPLAVEREAVGYVERLARVEPAPLSAERANHFVSGEQVLKLLPQAATRTLTPSQLERSPDVTPNTPITVVRSVEQVEQVSPAALIADSGGDLDAPVKEVLADDSVRTTTVGAVLERLRSQPAAKLRVLRKVDYFVQTTPAELLADSDVDRSKPIRIVIGNHGIELASVRDLIPAEQLTADSIFYVRTVQDTDDQGIWGIVHDGIIDNFARGMAIRRGREINTYQVTIPQDADELRADARSSFLGRLIYDKSQRSYVYNLRENRMGRNPDRITPGQEIIIINFEPDELIGIYKHFVNARG